MMELNYMLSYGAAKPSLCLLQKFNLLKIVLPVHVCVCVCFVLLCFFFPNFFWSPGIRGQAFTYYLSL